MSKYFNIHQSDDKTLTISTTDGKEIARDVTRYEINPKIPQYIKVCHNNYWWSLYDKSGKVLPDTSYVYDIVLNNDGSYHIKECGYESQWTRYDNGVTRKKIMNHIYTGLSYIGIVLCAVGLQRDCGGCEQNKKNFKPISEQYPIWVSSQKNNPPQIQQQNEAHER